MYCSSSVNACSDFYYCIDKTLGLRNGKVGEKYKITFKESELCVNILKANNTKFPYSPKNLYWEFFK